MQFREFGEWITRIADVHGDVCYTIYVRPEEEEDLVDLIRKLGVEDRFEVFMASALAPGRMDVITHARGQEHTVAVQPFFDALQAGLRADFPQQVFEATAEAMERDEPYRVYFPDDPDFTVTHPDGEHVG